MSSDNGTDRRSFLKAAGGAAAAATVAGCLGGGGGGGNGGGGGGNGNGSGGGGGGNGGGSGGTLVYARGSHSATLDPQNTTSGEDAKVTNQIYDQLIMFKPGESSLRSGLATDYSLDGTTTKLTLRKGVKFHNGEEFTASDFKATYRRFTDENYQYYPSADGETPYISGYGPFTLGDWVKSVKTNGKYDMEIELTQKYAPFLRNLAMFASSVHSEKAIKEKGKKLAKEPVGTGPFELDTLDDSNERILLTKNGDYWGNGPKVDEVVFNTIGQTSTRGQAVVEGEADIIDGLDAETSQQVKGSDGASLEQTDGINVGYMAFNMARVEEFRKKKVRLAISHAINTKAIVDDIYRGFAQQASQPIPPNLLGHNESLNPYPQDTEKAKQLLSEAGVGDGFSFELSTFKNPRGYNPSPIQTAEQVKSDLNKIGINVTINQMSFDPFLNYTDQGKHDACFLGWYTDNADPDNFCYALLHPQVEKSEIPQGQDWVSFDTEGFNTLNVAAWANEEYMDLTEQGQKAYQDAERRKLYKQAAKIARDEAPWVFIDNAKELRGVSNRVSGYTVSAIGGPYLNRLSVQ